MTLVFAVHPVHSESVAWVAGSPDLLFGLMTVLSLIFFERAMTKGRLSTELFASIVCYLFALGSKETAFFCLPIFFLMALLRDDGRTFKFLSVIPFAAAAIVYFVARWSVIGAISRPMDDQTGFTAGIISAPEVFVFYLKQIFFPLTLGENYPLRPVSDIGMANFVLPLIVSLAAVGGCVLVALRDRIAAFGLAIFLLPIVPVLYVGTFPTDQIVHDRYLYLPLLGVLVLTFRILLLSSVFDKKTLHKPLAAVVAVIVVVLSVRSMTYNPVWGSDLALWSHNVEIDRNSSLSFTNLGAELSARKNYRAALAAYDRAVEIKPTALGMMGRGRTYISLGDTQKAIADLNRVISLKNEDVNAYTLYQAYESYAVAQQAASDLAEAERSLREGRKRLPIYAASLTEKLAVVLYLESKKNDALIELESVRQQAAREMTPEAASVFLRLGLLYAEAGKSDYASRDLNTYLQATANAADADIIADRKMADTTLRSLK